MCLLKISFFMELMAHLSSEYSNVDINTRGLFCFRKDARGLMLEFACSFHGMGVKYELMGV